MGGKRMGLPKVTLYNFGKDADNENDRESDGN